MKEERKVKNQQDFCRKYPHNSSGEVNLKESGIQVRKWQGPEFVNRKILKDLWGYVNTLGFIYFLPITFKYEISRSC